MLPWQQLNLILQPAVGLRSIFALDFSLHSWSSCDESMPAATVQGGDLLQKRRHNEDRRGGCHLTDQANRSALDAKTSDRR